MVGGVGRDRRSDQLSHDSEGVVCPSSKLAGPARQRSVGHLCYHDTFLASYRFFTLSELKPPRLPEINKNKNKNGEQFVARAAAQSHSEVVSAAVIISTSPVGGDNIAQSLCLTVKIIAAQLGQLGQPLCRRSFENSFLYGYHTQVQ